MKKLIVYSAIWCAMCKNLTARLDKDGIEYEMVDVDENPKEAREYGIRSLPSVRGVLNGEDAFVAMGDGVYETIKEWHRE